MEVEDGLLNGFQYSPGTYFVSLEVIDDRGEVTFVEYNAEVVILPKLTSKVPSINIITEYDERCSRVNLNFDLLHLLKTQMEKWRVQFYIDGKPLGEEIKSDYQANQIQQPYSVEFSPPKSGVFTVFAIARDNSGNFIMSDTVSFTQQVVRANPIV